MKFVALVSGGKDSIYAIHLAILEQQHELMACIHLGAPPSRPYTESPPGEERSDDDDDDDDEESYMYQSAGSNVVKCQIEECLNVPCLVYPRKGRSIQTGLMYRTTSTNASTSTEEKEEEEDEVEDLYQALVQAKALYPMIEGVCSGAILSNYQRNRIEQIVCHRLQLHSLAYLWRKSNPSLLLQEMIQNGNISAILIKTASPPGLIPHRHLNRTLHELFPYFQQLQHKYQFQLCGEGGEYESFVLDATIFTRAHFIINASQIQIDPYDDMIGTLHVTQYHTAPKSSPSIVLGVPDKVEHPETHSTKEFNSKAAKMRQQRFLSSRHHPVLLAPPPIPVSSSISPHTRIRRVNGGFYSISEITCPQTLHPTPLDPTKTNDDDDDDTISIRIQTEIHEILQLLQSLLETIHCTAHDILMVHVYVANISYFAILNEQYRHFFGVLLPPSRSTVDIGTIFGTHHVTKGTQSNIMMDCVVQCGSGAYMRECNYSSNTTTNKCTDCNSATASIETSPANDVPVNTLYANAAILNTFTKLRDVLHVQSRSYWAPVCVGPYSQTNTLRGCIHFCAGQIGLDPPTMQLKSNVWTDQLHQSWKNMANVLDALDACCIPNNLMSGILFISDTAFHFDDTTDGADEDDESEWKQLCTICNTQMLCNGNVVPGDIDGIIVDPNQLQNDDDDEYEDDETRIEVEKNRIPNRLLEETDVDVTVVCPLLVVSIPKMPVGALCEIEVVAASRRATNALHIQDYTHTNTTTRSTLSVEKTQPRMEERYQLGWDTGHDFVPAHEPPPETKLDDATTHVSFPQLPSPDKTIQDIQIQSYFRCLGSRATSCALVTAHLDDDSSEITTRVESLQRVADPYTVIHAMIMALKMESHFDFYNILHIRLYYVNTLIDGMSIRHLLQSVIQELISTTDTRPATTVIPVTDMGIISPSTMSKNDNETLATHPFFAMQALSIDPIRTEQSIWIHEGRHYN